MEQTVCVFKSMQLLVGETWLSLMQMLFCPTVVQLQLTKRTSQLLMKAHIKLTALELTSMHRLDDIFAAKQVFELNALLCNAWTR